MNKIKAWMNRLPDFVKRAIRTFVQAFVALLITNTAGWFASLQSWASCVGDNCQTFPDPSVLSKALIAAVMSAGVAVVTLVYNLLEEKTSLPPVLKGTVVPAAPAGSVITNTPDAPMVVQDTTTTTAIVPNPQGDETIEKH